MTNKTKSLMLAFGLLAAGAGLAEAADWNTGPTSVKTYRNTAAVPVPAPAPIPVYAAEWYVRADLNFAAASGGTVASIGPGLDLKSPDDMPRYFGGGIAVGRYITPSIRADLSIDYRSQQRVASNVTVNTRTEGRSSTADVRVLHWTDYYANEAQNGNYAAMLNGYYDFRNSTAFTPYIGGGVGVSMRMLSRTANDRHECSSMDVYPSDGSKATLNASCPYALAGITNAKEVVTAYGFAASLMAGVSYEVSPGVLWDSGYRFMYFNGSVAQASNTALGASIIRIGDRTDHEFRTGIRLNID